MPLRDHFHPPVGDDIPWEAIHGGWPMMMVLALKRVLPSNYQAMPNIHPGTRGLEVDVATFEGRGVGPNQNATAGGVATATDVWAPPEPSLAVCEPYSENDEYQVLIRDRHTRRLVATIELVSPSNKDRPESRRAFVSKCAAFIRQQVSVTIVDLVTPRHFNLYADLLDFTGRSDPRWEHAPPHLYATTCYGERQGADWVFKTWAYPLVVGQPLPTLPVWLTGEDSVPLALEQTYEETYRAFGLN